MTRTKYLWKHTDGQDLKRAERMLLIFVINALVMMLAVLVHFEMLSQLSRFMPQLTLRYRFRIALGILGALIAHIIEVWIFAFAYFFLIQSGQFGHLQGMPEAGLFDCAYYSFVVYTTLGFGDIVPHGELRFLTGLESLTGLVLITWTASFMFYEMQKYWSADE